MQAKQLAQPIDVLIGTPQRLLQHAEKGNLFYGCGQSCNRPWACLCLAVTSDIIARQQNSVIDTAAVLSVRYQLPPR